MELYKMGKCPYYNVMGTDGLNKCLASEDSGLCHNYNGDCEQKIDATKAEILNKAKELIDVSDEKKEELIEICQVDDKYREEVYEEINKFISSLFEEV